MKVRTFRAVFTRPANRRGRKVQRRHAAVRGHGPGITAGGEQSVDHRTVSTLAGEVERRVTADSCLRLQIGDLGVAAPRRPVQRGQAVALRRVHVGPVIEERSDGGRVAAARGVDERAIGRGLGACSVDCW